MAGNERGFGEIIFYSVMADKLSGSRSVGCGFT